jgi:hypothetical protein
MPKIQFVNNLDVQITGYVSGGSTDDDPASSGPINPGGGVGVVQVPGDGWRVTVQLATSPPLSQNSPQSNIMARSGGINGGTNKGFIIIINKLGVISVTEE